MEFKHKHPLILNEKYHGAEGNVCHICKEQIHSRLIYSVYSCSNTTDHNVDDFEESRVVTRNTRLPGADSSHLTVTINDDFDCANLFMHKSCAELPLTIANYSMHPYHTISLSKTQPYFCDICTKWSEGRLCYRCQKCYHLEVCINCAICHSVHHPGHNQHELTLVPRPASFRCYACQKDHEYDESSSSCKCNDCPFWIHIKCALLPSLLKYEFHRHPLLLSYSLPQQYLRFRHNCSICHVIVTPTQWLYHCANCRFLAHISCAATTTTTADHSKMWSSSDDIDNLVHLLAHDEPALNFLRQLFIQKWLISNLHEASDKSSTAPSSIADNEIINHWSHEQHPLTLKKKSDGLDDHCIVGDGGDDSITICDGCTKPIYSSDASYQCHPCKYLLHKYCAELPKQMQSNGQEGHLMHSNFCFNCNGCKLTCNGMRMMTENGGVQLDIGCASLPQKINHEAHHHSLTQIVGHPGDECTACCQDLDYNETIFCCQTCKVYLHGRCALKPYNVGHPWDPHPLTLTMNFDKIEDHPHDFNCEFCSQDIDTNAWFYHCSDCDLSIHIFCIDSFDRYSHIKFGNSSIYVDQQLHEHGLMLVLNKRKRCCSRCGLQLYTSPVYTAPVLECRLCNFIFCISCVNPELSRTITNFPDIAC